MALDRYAYTYNNPIKYIDPNGNSACHPEVCDNINQPPSSGYAFGFSADYWESTYVSQGSGTNDCGPSNGAMVLNAVSTVSWSKGDVQPWRLPFPESVKGATPPWSLAKEMNKIATGNELTIEGNYITHGSKDMIISEVNDGNAVSAILVFNKKVAHWITIIGYDKDTDTIHYMDPNPEYNKPGENKIRTQTWEDFEDDWARQVWWTSLLNMRNEMIVWDYKGYIYKPERYFGPAFEDPMQAPQPN